jgi:protein-L-isoaspartate(D-aspartate) O-methyltransferase
MWSRLRQWVKMENTGSPPSAPWEEGWDEITDPKVRAAFAQVARQEFVDAQLREYADRDAPLPIGQGQTISQPFVVALMVQALALQPGARVLEIGTGSGYETAILCEVAAVTDPDQPAAERRLGAHIYAVERHVELADRAQVVLARLGYHPHLRTGDGAAGWPEAAPFDAIIVSAAAAHVPLPLWQQVAEGGRLILPVGEAYGEQELWLLTRREGQMERMRMGSVRFVPLISPLLRDPTLWAENF